MKQQEPPFVNFVSISIFILRNTRAYTLLSKSHSAIIHLEVIFKMHYSVAFHITSPIESATSN